MPDMKKPRKGLNIFALRPFIIYDGGVSGDDGHGGGACAFAANLLFYLL
jgi:hypothetical protein